MLNIPNINEFKGIDVSSMQSIKSSATELSGANLQTQTNGIVKDVNSISEISRYLSESKIDINESSASYDGQNLDFNLTFRKSSTESINAKGYFSSQTEEFNFQLNMKFKRYVIEDGVMKEKPFEAEFNFNSSNMKSVSVEQSYQKEDVYKFLSRILSKIFELSGNKTKNLKGVTFNVEDLVDMAQIGDLKTSKMVNEVINIAIFTAQLKQMIKERARNQEDVTLIAQRQIDETTTKNKSFFNITEFSAKVKEAPVTESENKDNSSSGSK